LPLVLATWFVVISLNIFRINLRRASRLLKVSVISMVVNKSSAALEAIFYMLSAFFIMGIASLEASIFFIKHILYHSFQSGSKISSSANCCKVLWNLFSKAFLKYSNPSPGSYTLSLVQIENWVLFSFIQRQFGKPVWWLSMILVVIFCSVD
jgi:hypothetical protein